MNNFLSALFLLCFSGMFSSAYAEINCVVVNVNTKKCTGYDSYGKNADFTMEERGFENFYITGKYDYQYYYNEPLPKELEGEMFDVYHDVYHNNKTEEIDVEPIVDFIVKKAPKLLHW